jgi:ADP-ribose pyrophosphatase YjhB (NUDIX family)
VCVQCGFIFYLDPKIAVATIIRMADERIVLVRRAINPGYGLWVFPGGYVDRGEEILEAAIREAREESGLDVRLDGLVNIYSYAGRTPIIVVYAATAIGGDLCCGDDECLEAGTFTAADVPWDELAFPSTREALHDYLTGMLHPLKIRR